MDPVSDLKAIGSDSVVQPTSSRDSAVDEHAHNEIAARPPVLLPSSDVLAALGQRQRFPGNPGHPRSQMLEALTNRLRQTRRVVDHPPAKHQIAVTSKEFWKSPDHALGS
jgi:hypothetical protein